ncbi:hypothetical protein [Gulosibacter massiliensis]|uniref:hypothetical protein n=1 Tax=Gulosibacter massiliensis TaxID=2479839 RepID=UPI000F641C64|nr:hypothetical protein [Gulosibacter massiliensis]
MNLQETAQVLAKIQLGDNRQVDELTVREWHDSIGHLAVHEAIEAVRMHRRESLNYLMPAHVIANVHRVRDRIAAESRKDRQVESRRQDLELRARQRSREDVWRDMLADPHESERTKAWIREQLQ